MTLRCYRLLNAGRVRRRRPLRDPPYAQGDSAARDGLWVQEGYIRFFGDGSCLYPADWRLASAGAAILFALDHVHNREIPVDGDQTAPRAEALVILTAFEGLDFSWWASLDCLPVVYGANLRRR